MTGVNKSFWSDAGKYQIGDIIKTDHNGSLIIEKVDKTFFYRLLKKKMQNYWFKNVVEEVKNV